MNTNDKISLAKNILENPAKWHKKHKKFKKTKKSERRFFTPFNISNADYYKKLIIKIM
jgi:ABC-type xylose transport system substrate-binding protein